MIWVASFCVMLVCVGAMAVGVMFGQRPIAGSCGGLNNLEGSDGECSFCGRPSGERCRRETTREGDPGA